MDISLERKIRSAAAAGWWTLLAGAAVLLLQWFAYLFIEQTRPSWATFLLGPGMTWDHYLNVWWLTTVFFKGLLAILALSCLWLTLWARELRRTGGA
jgi:hypothetical protein